MRPEQTEKALRQFLKKSGKALKSLSATDVLQVATDFWLATEIEGGRLENGDGLVAYFELVNRGRGVLYKFGINRIMCMPPERDEYSPWLPASSLRISVGFKTTLQVFQLGQVVSSFMCWEKQAIAGFIEEVLASKPFQLVASYEQHSSAIAYTECSAPWGNPMHPSKGLTWAIA